MKMHPHVASLGLPILIVIGVWQAGGAQPWNGSLVAPAALLGADEVVSNLVRRNLERARALAAYHGTRTYRVEYHGFPGSRVAEMIVDMNYRAPATKEFTVRSETGSKLLIDRVFKKMLQSENEALTVANQRALALNKENYTFKLLGHEKTREGSAYILSVEPRTQNKLLYRGRIWVDAEDFAVLRIEGEPAKNPSFWTKDTKVEQVYTKVGKFWLPKSNRSTTTIRLGGHASFTIDYGDYQITATNPPDQTANKVAGHR